MTSQSGSGTGYPAPPSFASGVWTWVNQGPATVTDESDGLYVLAPANAGLSMRLLTMPMPAVPFTLTAGFYWQVPLVNYGFVGLALYGDVSTSFVTSGMGYSSGIVFQSGRFNSPTSFNTVGPFADHGSDLQFTEPAWIRLVDDGTNRQYYFSTDGRHWLLRASESRTLFVTPTKLAIVVNSETASWPTWGKFFSWLVTTP